MALMIMIAAKLLGQGCECVVLKHGTNKVLKIYCTRENALYAIHAQYKAHEAGIAPQMFSDEPVKKHRAIRDKWGGEHRYAIISEYVRPAVRGDFDEYDDCNDEPIDDKYSELVSGVECLFGDAFDLHTGNLGWTTDGRLVAIDFGALSISRSDV